MLQRMNEQCNRQTLQRMNDINRFIDPQVKYRQRAFVLEKCLKKRKEEKGKRIERCGAPGQWKVTGAVLGAVSEVKSVCLLKHTRELYIWAHAVDREKDKGRETEGASYLWGSRTSSPAGGWEEQALRKHLASACVADTAAPLRATHGLRLAARKAHRER